MYEFLCFNEDEGLETTVESFSIIEAIMIFHHAHGVFPTAVTLRDSEQRKLQVQKLADLKKEKSELQDIVYRQKNKIDNLEYALSDLYVAAKKAQTAMRGEYNGLG